MGFRLIRIGNKVNVGEVKGLSARRSLRGSSIIIAIMLLLAVIVIVKCFGHEVPDWLAVVVSMFITCCVGLIDRRLPRRRWGALAVLLLLMGVTFTAFGVWRFAVKQMPMEADAWILGIMMLLSYGYGFFALWRWRRQILMCKDILLQRELRARRRRKMVY
jgi:hypothetical protein